MADKPKRTKVVTDQEKSATPDKKPAAESTTRRSSAVSDESSSGWNGGSLFWGLLLVVIGSLLLLGNFGVLDISWSALWQLWPLLVIAAGFSVLATNSLLWRILSVVFIITALAAVVAVATGQYETRTDGRQERQEMSVSLDRNVQRAEVELSVGASRLEINSADTDEVVSGTLESNMSKLNKESRVDGTTQYVKLSSERDHNWWMGSQRNDWNLTLSERVPMQLFLDAGASSTTADLSKVQLTSLNVKAGASSSELKLGNKTSILKVNIDSGASSLKVLVPKDSGVSLQFEGGLSSKDLADLKETSEGMYQSDEYIAAANKIDFIVDAGLASFKIERY